MGIDSEISTLLYLELATHEGRYLPTVDTTGTNLRMVTQNWTAVTGYQSDGFQSSM